MNKFQIKSFFGNKESFSPDAMRFGSLALPIRPNNLSILDLGKSKVVKISPFEEGHLIIIEANESISIYFNFNQEKGSKLLTSMQIESPVKNVEVETNQIIISLENGEKIEHSSILNPNQYTLTA